MRAAGIADACPVVPSLWVSSCSLRIARRSRPMRPHGLPACAHALICGVRIDAEPFALRPLPSLQRMVGSRFRLSSVFWTQRRKLTEAIG